MHAAIKVHDSIAGVLRPHTRCTNWVVQRERLLLHKSEQLLVRDGIWVAARRWPPEVAWVIICWHWLEELGPVRTTGNLDAHAEPSKEYLTVIIASIAKVLRINNG